MKLALEQYFKSGHVCITTSGNFCAKVLKFTIGEIGTERIMFSIVSTELVVMITLRLSTRSSGGGKILL